MRTELTGGRSSDALADAYEAGRKAGLDEAQRNLEDAEVMREVAEAFHRLAVKDRDAARVRATETGLLAEELRRALREIHSATDHPPPYSEALVHRVFTIARIALENTSAPKPDRMSTAMQEARDRARGSR